MESIIYISGRIIKGETLIDVIRQFKSFEDPSELVVDINSHGGNKEEGDAIHDYLKNIGEEIPVTTKTEKAYSIAAKIFAAGSKRIVSDKENVIGVHFARVTPKGEFTAEQLELITSELFEIKTEFINFYSEHLDIDKDTVSNLLENETVLSGEKAVELGFATEVEKVVEIIAELNFDNSYNNNIMTKKKDKGFLKKLMADISAFLDINAEMTLQDSNGTDIVFPDLESGDTPKVGDKATIDGAAIPDESYIMPSLEDSTLVFVGGAITEITEKVVEEEIVAEEVSQISVWTMEVLNTTFAVGDKVTRNGWEEGTEESVGSGEFMLEDGRRVVTDASGIIVLIKEADVAELVIDTEANFEALLEKVTEKVTGKINAEFEAKMTLKDNEIKSLKKKIGSKEFKAEGEEDLIITKPKKKTMVEVLQTKKEQ